MRRPSVVLHLVSAAATMLALGPVFAPGYVLVYDMVFTPRLPLSWDAAGLAPGLPRAVPQDAVVAVLSTVVPGQVLQKLALAAVMYLAVLGAARLLPAGSTSARVVAGLAFGWSAFVAERLFIGHWSLLLAYAALPWIVRAALRPGGAAAVVGWSALAALTPTGGLLALAATGVSMACTDRSRAVKVLTIGAVAALNAPWLVAGALADGAGRSDAAGVAAFAVRAENWSGPLGALLGSGGVWNAQSVPVSRTTALAPVFTVVVLAGAAYGLRLLRERLARGAAALVVLAGAGLVLALLGAVPGARQALAWLVTAVPGAGLLRDGQKFVAPFALLVALAFALGVERLADRWGGAGARVLVAGALLLPFAALPDLAWGGLGRLRPVEFPRSWQSTARYLAEHGRGERDELVVLPLRTFRAFAFNARRTSLDHSQRYLPVRVVPDDRLVVGGQVVAGESRRVAEVAGRLAVGESMAGSGARWVLVLAGPPAPASALDGLRRVHVDGELSLYEDPAAPLVPLPPMRNRVLLALAYALAAAAVCAAAAIQACRRPVTRS